MLVDHVDGPNAILARQWPVLRRKIRRQVRFALWFIVFDKLNGLLSSETLQNSASFKNPFSGTEKERERLNAHCALHKSCIKMLESEIRRGLVGYKPAECSMGFLFEAPRFNALESGQFEF